MASQDPWADYETLRHNLKYYKVDHLKQVIAGFNEECGTNLIKSGKKQEILDRILRQLFDWRMHNEVDKWMKAKTLANRIRTTGMYTPTTSAAAAAAAPSSSTNNASSSGQPHGYAEIQDNVPYRPGHLVPRYDSFAPPRRPNYVGPLSPAQAPPIPSIRFKFSPFFRIETIVTPVVECPESTTSMDRRSQSISFVMTNDLLQKLAIASPKYQLRLYCTSSTYYTPQGTFRSPVTTPCPIEFPPTCEVRVNGTQLNANLKGLKKKPGTAPPPDLGKVLRMQQSASNRIEMIYVNSQQPTPPKKYYLVVMLVEVTSVDQLIDRLRKGKFRSREEVLADMNKAVSDDDDIIAGHQKMSLKCPLSYMRITTPCRSKICVHPQCFDAVSWYSVMEQTTTWMCPVCEKVLSTEELYIDGYFDDILKQTPEEVEDVIVEADGQWHTEDNKYGSAEWKAGHPSAPPPKPLVRRPPSPTKPVTNGVDGKDKPRAQTPIEISDSEDEDEGRVKRELSPSTDGLIPRASQSSNGGSQPRRSHVPDIIDLTLSDDDEPPPPRPSAPVQSKKRKEMEDLPSPTEQIWKKSRIDSSLSPTTVTLNELVNNSTLRMADEARRHGPIPSSSHSRYSSSQSPYRGSGSSQSYGSPGALPLPPHLPQRPSSSSRDSTYRNPLPPPPFIPQRGSGAGSSSPTNWR